MANTSRFATSAEVIAWYPSLSVVEPDVFSMVLDSVQCLFNVDAWGCNLLMGSLYAAAHMLLLQQQSAATGSTGGGTSGPITAMSMGPVAISYANTTSNTGTDGSWQLTSAGQQYLGLRAQIGPMAVAFPADCRPWSSMTGCGCP